MKVQLVGLLLICSIPSARGDDPQWPDVPLTRSVCESFARTQIETLTGKRCEDASPSELAAVHEIGVEPRYIMQLSEVTDLPGLRKIRYQCAEDGVPRIGELSRLGSVREIHASGYRCFFRLDWLAGLENQLERLSATEFGVTFSSGPTPVLIPALRSFSYATSSSGLGATLLRAFPGLLELDLNVSESGSSVGAQPAVETALLAAPPSLRSLRLRNQSGWTFRPGTLQQLDRLESLSVSVIQEFKGVQILPGGLSSLSGLKALELLGLEGGRDVNVIDGDVFSSLQRLERLALAGMGRSVYPSKFSPRALTDLRTLRSLRISGMEVGKFEPQDVRNLLELDEIEITKGSVASGAGVSAFEALALLPKLRKLNLSASNAPFPPVERMPSLEEIACIRCGGATPRTLFREGIRHADYSGTAVGKWLEDGRIRVNSTIQSLRLDRDVGYGLPLSSLSWLMTEDLPLLRELSVQGNSIAEIPVGFFAKLPSLESLNLCGNPLSARSIRRMFHEAPSTVRIWMDFGGQCTEHSASKRSAIH